jgi:TonB family protein
MAGDFAAAAVEMHRGDLMPQAQLRQDRTLEIQTTYRDVVIGTRHIAPAPGRLLASKRRGRFRIGSGAGIDAPVAPRFVPTPSHVLVDANHDEPEVHVTPLMTGDVTIGAERFSLPAFVQQRGPSFALPADGRARLRCGDVTFLIAPTTMPARLPARPFVWRWSEMIYPVGAVSVLALFLLMIFAVPGDLNALSLDHLGLDHHLIQFHIKPPEQIAVAETGSGPALPQKTAASKPGAGESGTMREVMSRNRRDRPVAGGLRGNRDARLSKELALREAERSGILGVLARSDSAHVASVFERTTAFNGDAAEVLSDLVGTQIADAYTIGGTPPGTGDREGGGHEGLIGTPGLITIGPRHGTDVGWGPQGGGDRLPPRKQKPLAFIPGIPTVRGSLDKEVIRRIVRHHLNEVKYCYEQELVRAPGLAGRVVVQFAIAPGGQVITSALQSSTMGNARVENCTVQAIRRWSFPAPSGGGLVIVSYPFVLNPAGGP